MESAPRFVTFFLNQWISSSSVLRCYKVVAQNGKKSRLSGLDSAPRFVTFFVVLKKRRFWGVESGFVSSVSIEERNLSFCCRVCCRGHVLYRCWLESGFVSSVCTGERNLWFRVCFCCREQVLFRCWFRGVWMKTLKVE